MMVYKLSSMFMKKRIDIWFDDGLWVSKYVYEIEKWDMFYELYDELRFNDMFEKVWIAYDAKWCIKCVKACAWWLWHECIAWNEIISVERKTVWVEVPRPLMWRPVGWKSHWPQQHDCLGWSLIGLKSHRQLKCKTGWVKVSLASIRKQGKQMKGKHDMMYDTIYDLWRFSC